jgi:hypothetical protein
MRAMQPFRLESRVGDVTIHRSFIGFKDLGKVGRGISERGIRPQGIDF